MLTDIPPPLIPIALFYLICALVSLVGNSIMCLCFVKEKKFHTPCHYLITLTCLSDLLHLCGHFVFNYQLFLSGSGSQELCFWLLLPSTLGLLLTSPLLLSMGIDRFIACQFPVLYRSISSRPFSYLVFQLIFPILYTIYLSTLSFLQRDPDTLVICQVPLAMGGSSFEQFNQGGLFINFLVVVVYFLTFLKLRKMAGKNTQMKVIFRSILYTVALVIFGWSTVTLTNIIGIQLVKDINLLRIVMIYAGIGLNVASSSNVFVFYTINSEYRSAIRRMIGLSTMVPRHSKISIVGSTTKVAQSPFF